MTGIVTYPGHSYCKDEFLANLKEMVCHSRDAGIEVTPVIFWNGNRHPKGFKHKVIRYYNKADERGIDILCNKQNQMRDYFLQHDFTHLFNLESDNIPSIDTITNFVKHEKDMVSSLYFIKTQEYVTINVPENSQWGEMGLQGKAAIVRQRLIPSVWGIFGTKSRLWDIDDALPQRGLVRALSAGVGSVLITREVLEEIKFKIRTPEVNQQFTDFIFFKEAFDKGFELFVDTDNWAEHRHLDDDDQVFTKWFDTKTLSKA